MCMYACLDRLASCQTLNEKKTTARPGIAVIVILLDAIWWGNNP